MKNLYHPPTIWSGRIDANAVSQRVHEIVRMVDLTAASSLDSLQSRDIVLLGFMCDEGIRRNQGRIGAKEGPAHIRQQLASLVLRNPNRKKILDAGDVGCDGENLEDAQLALGNCINVIVARGAIPIVFGGGHETAWGNFQGLTKHLAALSSVGIINFDAHFDLRPLPEDQKGSSGTPFLQIANWCADHQTPFSYSCIGIQPQANTQELFAQAQKLGVQYTLAETIHAQELQGTEKILTETLNKHHSIYASLCLDVFAHSFAPGVSAPQAFGLTPTQVLPLWRKLLKSGKIATLDLVELSPTLDISSQTSKLAAFFALQALEYLE